LLQAQAGELAAGSRSLAVLDSQRRLNVSNATRIAPGLRPAETLASLADSEADMDAICVEDAGDSVMLAAAAEAAGRGRLVLAGIAAADAGEAMAMLLESGLPRWRLAAALRAIVAMRTIRRLCEECKTTAPPDREVAELLCLPAEAFGDAWPSPGRCEHCGRTGYTGLMPTGAVVAVDKALAALLRAGEAQDLLAEADRLGGIDAMRRIAAEKVRSGLTTPAELARHFA